MENTKLPEALDTLVLLRIITNDIPAQAEKAKRLVGSKKKFFVADMVFFEIVYVLEGMYGWSRKTIATALSMAIIDRSNIECNKSLIYQVLDDYVRHPKLSFGDCYLVWKTRIAGTTPLWTFDKKLASQMDAAELIK